MMLSVVHYYYSIWIVLLWLRGCNSIFGGNYWLLIEWRRRLLTSLMQHRHASYLRRAFPHISVRSGEAKASTWFEGLLSCLPLALLFGLLRLGHRVCIVRCGRWHELLTLVRVTRFARRTKNRTLDLLHLHMLLLQRHRWDCHSLASAFLGHGRLACILLLALPRLRGAHVPYKGLLIIATCICCRSSLLSFWLHCMIVVYWEIIIVSEIIMIRSVVILLSLMFHDDCRWGGRLSGVGFLGSIAAASASRFRGGLSLPLLLFFDRLVWCLLLDWVCWGASWLVLLQQSRRLFPWRSSTHCSTAWGSTRSSSIGGLVCHESWGRR